MPDLLLELRSEEIPARMQRKAAGDLKKMVTDGLVEAGLTYEGCQEYWTPRRLTLDVRGVTARSKDVREEKKGPSTKAPEQAIAGFLRSAGLSDIGQAHVHSDPKKGDFYVAHISKPGRAAEEIIAELVPSVIRAFPWPKSMRWGAASAKPGSLRWVRPLQSIVCTFGPETEEPVVVDFEVDGIRAGNTTFGHRFHAPDAITVRRFDDYAAKLEAAKVVIDADRRKEIILADAKNLAFANGLELVEDDGLLEEVSGLVEWPVVLLGEFEADFLAIPAEVIRLTIRANQKCFVTRAQGDHPTPDLRSDLPGQATGLARPSDPHRGEGGALHSRNSEPAESEQVLALSSPSMGEVDRRSRAGGGDATLSNRFIVTANIEARDGGAEIAHGNGKVVRARLSDALYFWKTDQSDLPDLDKLQASAEKFDLDLTKPLDQRMARLDHLGVTFHAKLGTQGERVERIARLAAEIAPIVARGISPLEGEMSAKPTEGVGQGSAGPKGTSSTAAATPPGGFAATLPSRGREITALARRAAVLAKADLTTEIVGEFPELQGAMGRKYALLQGEHPSVAAAIEEHYKPQGPSDFVPTDPVSIAVALADKLDTLVGFWAIDEKPTGSKDPYALRRAALGVIRILVENGVRLGLLSAIENATRTAALREIALVSEIASFQGVPAEQREFLEHNGIPFMRGFNASTGVTSGVSGHPSYFKFAWFSPRLFAEQLANFPIWANEYSPADGPADLLSFFHDRLKVYLRDQGARHDLIDAVLAGGGISPLDGEMAAQQPEGVPSDGTATTSSTAEATPPRSAARIDPPLKGEGGVALNDDLLQIVRRVEALGTFLETEDGKNLLTGTKRAANILAAEEKRGTAVAGAVNPDLLSHPAEIALFAAVNQAERQAAQAILNEDFSAAMRALSALREPVDSFFERVLVNDEDVAVRANRLALLARIRAATDRVADFSRIAG